MLARSSSTITVPFDAISPSPRTPDERNVGATEGSLSRFGQAEAIVTKGGTRRIITNKVTLWTLLFCSAFFGAIARAQITWPISAPPMAPAGQIQYYIDNVVSNGDTILLSAGTYPEFITFNNRAITIKSINGATTTTIIDPGLTTGSPQVPVVSFDHGEGPNSVLQDVTIRGGSGDGMPFHGGGIRIVNSSPTIDGCMITSNGALLQTPKGGGIYIKGGAPVIKHNTITGNSATDHGGGIYCEDTQAIIQENGGTLVVTYPGQISLNSAGMKGGGIYVTGNSAVTIDNNAIGANTVNLGSGGGVAIEGSMTTVTTTSLTYNQIVANVVNSAPNLWDGGGGIACLSTAPAAVQMLHNVITGNRSGGDGGGIHCYQSSPSIYSLNTLTGNIADGCGGGINLYDHSSPPIANTTISGNHAFTSGGGMCIREDSNASVRGCAINGNFASQDGGGVFIRDSSPIIGSTRLIGNGTADPMNGSAVTQFGGGVAIRKQSATVVAPTIVGCSIFANFAQLQGGGIFMYNCTAAISSNIISGNGTTFQTGVQIYTQNGGGIYAFQGSPLIDANTVIANQVGPNGLGVGAGVSLDSLAAGSPPFTNNIVVQNWAHQGNSGGVYAVGLVSYQLINNTIADNNIGLTQTPPLSMNALYNSGSTLDLWNCIVRGDANTLPIVDVAPGVTTDNYCVPPTSPPTSSNNIGPMWTPVGLPPQFVNTSHGDYRLIPGSPCIDKGCIPSGGWPLTALKDFENEARPNPTTGLPDIGADEHYP